MNLKSLLGQNAFWMVNKSLALKVGVEAALLLSLLIDLDNGEWFDCQRDYITEKTGMKRRAITSAISKLEGAGFVEKRVSGVPPKTQFLMCTNQIVQNVRIKTCKTYESNGTKCTNILINKKEVIKKENKKRVREIFKKPEILEVSEFFVSLGSTEYEAEKFYDFYQSKNWQVGKSKMKDWKAAARNWKRRNDERTTKDRNQNNNNVTLTDIQSIVNKRT